MTLFVLFQGYETQKYRVVEQLGKVEIRYYPPAMKVKTKGRTSKNNNFNTLFRYISGHNVKKEKIAMTTPVYIFSEGDAEVMEFVLPSKYKGEAPAAVAANTEVYESAEGYYAAISFGGYANATKVKTYTQELLKALRVAGKSLVGKPQLLSYDAPFKFYNRRNEMLVEIKK